MESKGLVSNLISEALVGGVYLVQLLQCLSYIKYAPKALKGGTAIQGWDSGVNDFFNFCKNLALRFDGDAFLYLYGFSSVICVLTLAAYILLSPQIHALNKRPGPGQYLILFVEYVIFGLGLIPMISKFVEVQICNSASEIDSANSVDCFGNSQLALLQVGFICISAAYILNAAIFPTLRAEREGIEKLWWNESYFEGLYQMTLIFVVSLLCYIEEPIVGVLYCLGVYLYAVIFRCYNSVNISCIKAANLLTLVWAFGAAREFDNNTDSAKVLIYLLPIGYILGYTLKLLKEATIKKLTERLKF